MLSEHRVRSMQHCALASDGWRGKHHRRAEVQLRKRLLIINLLYTTMNKMTNIDPTHLWSEGDEISLLLCHLCHSAIWHNLCKHGKNGVFRAFYQKMPNGILAEVAQNWVTSREKQRNVTAKLTQRYSKINATLQQNLRNVTHKSTQRCVKSTIR